MCYFCGEKGHIVRDCPVHWNAIVAYGVPPEVVERYCDSFGKKLAEMEPQALQQRPAPVMDAAKKNQSQLVKNPTEQAQVASPPKPVIRLNTVEQTPPRTPPRPQPEASRLVEAARAQPKVEISGGETKVRQILKPIESLTVVRRDALETGYH